VRLQLQNLCKVSEARKDSLVRQALDGLPKGLHDTYARISQQIMEKPEYLRSLGIRCLRWVLYAQYPLTVPELQYALATFDDNQNGKDFELDALDVIFGACANLVTTPEKQPYVRLIHYSAQEYFASDDQSLHSQILKPPIGNRMEANASLAADCLAHFYQPMMSFEQCEPTNDIFLYYAASCFDSHLLAADPKIARRHIDKLLENDSELFDNILNIRVMASSEWFTRNPKAARAGFPQKLIAGPIEQWTASSLVAATDLLSFSGLERENLSQDGLNSALFFACGRTGSFEKIRQLIDAGADVNCCDIDGLSPLFYALLREDMALLLIQNGANVVAHDRNGGNILEKAARYGGPKLIRSILEAGADITDEAPLASAALSRGKIENVRLLVEAGADVNATEGLSEPALHAACAMADLEVVAYLLDNGADINLKCGRYGSPLCAFLKGIATAFKSGHDVFLLLLRRGARVDVEALMSAATNFLVRELSKILLELDEGPRYSASNIRAALTAVRRRSAEDCGRRCKQRMRDHKKVVIRLLEMRLSPSGNGKKLALRPEIRAMTKSIYEAECEWVGDTVWRRDRGRDYDGVWGLDIDSDSERKYDSDSEGEKSSSRHYDVLRQKKGRLVAGRHRARRVYVWFVTRTSRSRDGGVDTRILLHEHGWYPRAEGN
jgi:ankyrin repeat protein